MTETRDVRYFQQIPDAVTGDVLDSLTLNNNFSRFGKMKYLDAFGNLDTSRINLNITAASARTTTSGVEYLLDWENATLPNANMWTSGSVINIPSSGVYAVSLRVAFRGLGTPTTGLFPGIQSGRILLYDFDGTPIKNIANRGFNQVAADLQFSMTGFAFIYEGQFLQAAASQATGATQTVFGNIQVIRLPIFLKDVTL